MEQSQKQYNSIEEIIKEFDEECKIAQKQPFESEHSKEILPRFQLSNIQQYVPKEIAIWKQYKLITDDNETQIKQYMNQLVNLSQENCIRPDLENVLDFLRYFPKDINCVIIGQDPYYKIYKNKQTKEEIKYACGKSFVIDPRIPFSEIPESLKTIFKALQKDYDFLTANKQYFNKDPQYIKQIVHHVVSCKNRDDFYMITDFESEQYKELEEQMNKFQEKNAIDYELCTTNMFDDILKNKFDIELFKNTKRKEIGSMYCQQKQGLLLLNRVLSVGDKAGSHNAIGWQNLTQDIIKNMNKEKKNVVYMLFGKESQKMENLVNKSSNILICKPHPSPINPQNVYNFIQKSPFLECFIRQYMIDSTDNKQNTIDWWMTR